MYKNDYEELKDKGTGSQEELHDYKTIVYPFDKYEIKIKLKPNNEFLEVIEVKINKDFLSHKQKITHADYHDVEEFYRK